MELLRAELELVGGDRGAAHQGVILSRCWAARGPQDKLGTSQSEKKKVPECPTQSKMKKNVLS